MNKYMIRLIIIYMMTFGVNALAFEPYLNNQLLEAASRGETELARDSILSGANVDARDRLGNTPLILACDAGYQEIVRLLITHKASVNAVNKFGYTPLMSAVTNSHRYIASLLIKAGADPKLPNKFGTTPEMYIKAQGFFTMNEYIGDEKPAISAIVDDRPERRGAMSGIHSPPWMEEFNRMIALGKTSEAAEFLVGYASSNNHEAAYILGTLFLSKGNLEQGIFWLKKAAASNDSAMKYKAAKAIIDNADGAGLKDAVAILKEAIAKGNDFAKVEYGKLLLFGNGVPKDNANAFALFKDASSKDIPEAIYYTGMLEYLGRGVIQNEEKGLAKIQIAADLGFYEAEKFIDRINAEKNISMLANSSVGERATVKAYLISTGAPINIDDPECDVYTIGNSWNNAYGINSVKMCYPGDGKVNAVFIIKGDMGKDDLSFLKNTAPNAIFEFENGSRKTQDDSPKDEETAVNDNQTSEEDNSTVSGKGKKK